MNTRRSLIIMLSLVGCPTDGWNNSGTKNEEKKEEEKKDEIFYPGFAQGINHRGTYTTEDGLWSISLIERTMTMIDNTKKTSEVLYTDIYQYGDWGTVYSWNGHVMVIEDITWDDNKPRRWMFTYKGLEYHKDE